MHYWTFKFGKSGKSEESVSTWTESYEPYEYEAEYDQQSSSTQGTPTTIEAIKTTIRSETIVIATEPTASSSSQTESFTTKTATVTYSNSQIGKDLESTTENILELDCDNDAERMDTKRVQEPKFAPQSQLVNFENSRGSVQTEFQSQFSKQSSSYQSLSSERNSGTTRIIIQGQGNSGIQNVINCFGTYRNTSCIRQLCKVSIFGISNNMINFQINAFTGIF